MIVTVQGTYEMVQDLVADDARHFEALLAGDGVDNHVAMDADEVLRIEDAVFILQDDTGVSDGFLKNSLSSNVQLRKEGLVFSIGMAGEASREWGVEMRHI
jgi:hypothetical protein